MLKDFNRFIYELETTYLKELNSNIILNYIEDFYKNFIQNNSINVNGIILKKTAEAIVVCTDDILLQKSFLKNDWIKKTGENYLLHTNRGGEIINSIVDDIINERIINEETIYIISTCFILGARSDLKKQFIDFFHKQKSFYKLNLKENIEKSLIESSQTFNIDLVHIFIILFVGIYLLTEINYIFNIYSTTKNLSKILGNIRSIYELK
jgi:hypothetical protein